MPIVTLKQAKNLGMRSGDLHTVLIPLTFPLEKAKKWIREHGYNLRHRTTKNFYRFNQQPEVIGSKFYSKTLPNGIILTFQDF